ncbi:MAG: HAD family phosphatase [Deltaproteobacteria bacterium]|nr:HAD family phosphatase [Deltaproteobacteria bacterium]
MNDVLRRRYDLVVFDVDGTLVGSRDGRVVWRLINDRFLGDQEIDDQRWQAFLQGELLYEDWVRLDVEGWQSAGLSRERISSAIAADLYPMPGAKETIATLSDAGYRVAVISGTLNLTLEVLLPDCRFDAVFTNHVEFDDQGKISGWRATPYDMAGKADGLHRVCEELAVPVERAVFVGDNVNDIEIMKVAGFAIAYEPKAPSVADVADVVIEGDLRQLIELID